MSNKSTSKNAQQYDKEKSQYFCLQKELISLKKGFLVQYLIEHMT